MSPKEQSTQQDNSDFKDKIEASDLITAVLRRNFLSCIHRSHRHVFFNLLKILTEAKTAIRKKCPENKVIFV